MNDLSPQDARLAVLLSLGHSQKSAAEELGLAPETVSRKWTNDFDLRKEVRRLVRDRIDDQHRGSVALLQRANHELAKLLENDDPGVRLRAITLVHNVTAKALELNVGDEVDSLNKWVAEQKKKGRNQ